MSCGTILIKSLNLIGNESKRGGADRMKMDIRKQYLLLEGKKYTADDLCQLKAETEESESSPLRKLYEFLRLWFNDSPFITVQTSGSTGTPKVLTVRKEQMMQSARLTCEYLDLRAGDAALLCMNLSYIGAMMVVVRSLVAGLNLIVRPPSGHPLAGVTEPLRFAAMVPMQVYNTLQVSEEKERLCKIDVLIIGGGAVNAALETEIQSLPGAVYSTYGMTETLSHIALRRLNGPSASSHYHPFFSVQLSLSCDRTLVIDAPLVCDDVLSTNDIAHLYSDGTFEILGRKDNMINSGGVKVQAEWVEEQIRSVIPVPFVITSILDDKLGEAVVLLLEYVDHLDKVESMLPALLPPYHAPKYIRIVNEIPLTGNGKIDRGECRVLAKEVI